AEAPGTDDTFTAPIITRVPGGNVVRARGRDTYGNRSIPSDEAVLILNERPAALSGLASTVRGHDVTLTWNAAGDSDLFGYVVRRGGQNLTGSSLQTEATLSASSSRSGFSPEAAFDGNIFTAWLPEDGSLPADWSADFAAPILVDRVSIRFPSSSGDAAVTYRIEARWEDRYVPLVRSTTDARAVVDYVLPTPFATSGLRVVLESGRGIPEVTVSRKDPAAVGTTTFPDPGVGRV